MKKFKLTAPVPKESDEQKILANWLDVQGYLWTSSMVGVNIQSPALRALMKKMGVKRGFPDILIFDPSDPYVGCAIELKRADWKYRDSDEHMVEQRNILNDFRSRGWFAGFARGHKDAITLIDYYRRGVSRETFRYPWDPDLST